MPDEKITTNDLDFWLDHIDDIKNDIIQTVNDIPEERIKYELMKVAALIMMAESKLGSIIHELGNNKTNNRGDQT